MDIWNIYSIGDAYYLSQVLNAIAAICGTADFTSACAIALLVGVIIICVQTVIRGQGFPIQTAVICYVFWFICYYPTTSVNIHDVYTQTDRKVDNVPLGPAAIGSVVSTIGFKVTEMMETAFQMPTNSSTLTGSGAGNGGRYGNALYYLNNSLRLGSSPKMTLSLDEVNGDTDGDFYRSMSDYVRFCTFRAVQLGPNWGGKTAEQINNLPASEALKFDSKVYYTQVWTKGKPEDVNCSDGWAKILDKYKNALDLGSGSDVFADLIMRTGAVPETDPATAKQTAMALDIKVLTQGALESLRVDSSNSQYFMLGSLARDIYRAGMARGYNDYHDRQTAIMLNQAIAQRNVQWAAEQSMFFDSMRPMLSFVEGFVYAITPFAAFIMLLGVFGLSLYFKYFMMIVWI